jgi:beta-lactam-binding protein with PASTA domain
LREAQEWITLCGFRRGAVRRVPADGKPSGMIVGQLPLSGYPIARREVVELTVAD